MAEKTQMASSSLDTHPPAPALAPRRAPRGPQGRLRGERPGGKQPRVGRGRAAASFRILFGSAALRREAGSPVRCAEQMYRLCSARRAPEATGCLESHLIKRQTVPPLSGRCVYDEPALNCFQQSVLGQFESKKGALNIAQCPPHTPPLSPLLQLHRSN